MELNVFTMFMDSGLTIKAVILLLLFMSLYSWFIVFQKEMLYRKIRQESSEFIEKFWQCKNLSEANRTAKQAVLAPEAVIFQAAYQELQRLNKSQGGELRGGNRSAGIELLKRSTNRSLSGEISRLSRSLPFLASTGTASPFIGLFGTVWGIMTAFHEMGIRGSASLAVVAPGVSEALVSTAAGLAVAIPAVILYNYLTNRLVEIEDNSLAFASDFINLIERDLLSRSTSGEKQE